MQYVKANRVLTATGETVITEYDNDFYQCAEGEEVARVEVKVPLGTKCDICEEELKNDYSL